MSPAPDPGVGPRGRRAEQGAALPVALLVILTLTALIGALLLRSTVDMATGIAHRDAVADLFAAEGAAHAWIAGLRSAPEPAHTGREQGDGGEARVAVERLARLDPDAGDPDAASIFAVSADAGRNVGGRGVTLLVRAWEAPIPRWSTPPDAALVHGGDADLRAAWGAPAVIGDGADHPFCPADPPAAHAVVRSAGATTRVEGDARVEGAVEQSHLGPRELIRALLGGGTPRDLGWNAERRFGRYFTEAPFEAGREVSTRAADPRYRWGCPDELIRSLPGGIGAPIPCAADAGSAEIALVAIDAEGGEVVLDRGHAHGLLIVVNGSLRVDGSFVFQGVLVAEGDVTIRGGRSGWGPSVDGAVLAGGSVRVGSTAAGEGRSIRFNRCAVERVRERFDGREGGAWGTPRVLGRPFGWAEVLR